MVSSILFPFAYGISYEQTHFRTSLQSSFENEESAGNRLFAPAGQAIAMGPIASAVAGYLRQAGL
jgi:hypothetical protein